MQESTPNTTAPRPENNRNIVPGSNSSRSASPIISPTSSSSTSNSNPADLAALADKLKGVRIRELAREPIQRGNVDLPTSNQSPVGTASGEGSTSRAAQEHQQLRQCLAEKDTKIVQLEVRIPHHYRNTKQTMASSDTADSVATSGRSGTDSPRTPTTSTFESHRTTVLSSATPYPTTSSSSSKSSSSSTQLLLREKDEEISKLAARVEETKRYFVASIAFNHTASISKLEKSRSERDEALADREKMRAERDAARSERDRVSGERDGFARQLQEVRMERGRLKTALDAAEEERDDLRSELESTVEARDTAQSGADSRAARITELLAQVESVKEETRKMGIAVRSNEQAIEKATEETQELTSTNSSLVTQVEQIRSERDGTARHLKETLEELHRERTQRLDASSKWIEDVRKLKQELETAQEDLAGARSDVEQLNRDLCAVNSCLKNEKRVKVLYKKRCVDTEQARKRITSKYAALRAATHVDRTEGHGLREEGEMGLAGADREWAGIRNAEYEESGDIGTEEGSASMIAEKPSPIVPPSVISNISAYLVGDNAHGSAASFSMSCRSVRDTLRPILYETVILDRSRPEDDKEDLSNWFASREDSLKYIRFLFLSRNAVSSLIGEAGNGGEYFDPSVLKLRLPDLKIHVEWSTAPTTQEVAPRVLVIHDKLKAPIFFDMLSSIRLRCLARDDISQLGSLTEVNSVWFRKEGCIGDGHVRIESHPQTTSMLSFRLDSRELSPALLKTFGHVVKLLQNPDASVRGGAGLLWKASPPVNVRLEKVDARQVCALLKVLQNVTIAKTSRNVSVSFNVTSLGQGWKMADAVTLLNAMTKMTRTFWRSLASARQQSFRRASAVDGLDLVAIVTTLDDGTAFEGRVFPKWKTDDAEIVNATSSSTPLATDLISHSWHII